MMIIFQNPQLSDWTKDIYCANRDMTLNLYCLKKIDVLECSQS